MKKIQLVLLFTKKFNILKIYLDFFNNFLKKNFDIIKKKLILIIILLNYKKKNNYFLN